MSDFKLFFNTEIKNSNQFANVANNLLKPVRYFFNGKTVQIIRAEDDKYHVRDNLSFNGSHSKIYCDSSDKCGKVLTTDLKKDNITTAKMIALFVPGLILGTIFKIFAYLSNDVRNYHNLAKKHFTPIEKYEIGDKNRRLTIRQIKEQMKEFIKNNTLHKKINTLVIYADDEGLSYDDINILEASPEKLILDGLKVENLDTKDVNITLKDQLVACYEELKECDSVEEALKLGRGIDNITKESKPSCYIVKH
jgi:hypothetical protein